ncbi:MAG: maleate isomerase [Solirubrobacteraceae bacterium]|jgi:maleate isomerase|nr:maleate isomerase [Solirubrobacteraceae bacterium]
MTNNDPTKNPDSYRVGLIVPSSNTTMETEIPEMLTRRQALRPERFTFHSSRSRLQQVTPEELARMVRDADRCAAEVADARVDVVAYACLVALMAQGPGYHHQAEAAIGAVLEEAGSTAPVVTSAGALVDALSAMGARSVSIVAPYMKPVTAMVVAYIEEAGFDVVDARSLEVSDNLAVGRIPSSTLLGALDELDTTGADVVVLSACVQCPSLSAIPVAEARVGLPVISAGTATVHQLLSKLGLDPIVPDAGSLLASPGLAGVA